MARVISEKIKRPIADKILEGELRGGAIIYATMNNARVELTIERKVRKLRTVRS